MNNLNEKLTKFSVEKLEERKEFIFYCVPKPCQPTNPGNGGTNPGGGNNGGGA